MRHSLLTILSAGLLAAVSGLAQQGAGEYLDTLKVKVRPDRIREYEASVKKLVDINRKAGDRWVAYSTEFGDLGTFYFSSRREKMADIETGFANFEKAGKEFLGTAFPKFMGDLMAMSLSTTAELRRRRWDLSVNAPASSEDRMKLVATSRWIRTIRLEVKPGRMPEFIAAWKPWQEELARVDPRVSAWVSTTNSGAPALVAGTYFKTLGELDELDPLVGKAFGSQVYRDFMKASAELISSSQWEFHRLRPELSCVPDEFAALDPDFWRPKTMGTASRVKKEPAAEKKQ